MKTELDTKNNSNAKISKEKNNFKMDFDLRNKKFNKNFYYNEEQKTDKETGAFKYSGLKFRWLYHNIKLPYKFVIVALSAMVMGIITLFFIQNTGLYSSGISAFSQGLSRLTAAIMVGNYDIEEIELTSKILFYAISFVINIPGLIFAYYKIGKQFTMLTSTYVAFSTLFPLLISLIPGIGSIQLFGDVSSSILTRVDGEGVKVLPNSINFVLWNYDNEKVIALIFFAFGYSILASFPLTFCYVIGASGGGFDIIAIYLMKSKRKQLGTIFLINNLSILLIASFLGTFLTAGILGEKDLLGHLEDGIFIEVDKSQFIVENFFSPNFLCTIVLIFTFSRILNKFYPRFKMIGIQIVSPKKFGLDDQMFTEKFNHTRLVSSAVGGYRKEEQEIITIYCFLFEVNALITRAKKLNPQVFITIDESVSVEGTMSYRKFLY